MPDIQDKIEWSIRVSIFRNIIIIRQLAIAIGIPFGILVCFLVIIKAYFGLVLIAALFVLSYLFILLFWGGKYHAGFEIDSKGIRNYTLKDQARKNTMLNIMTMIAGLISGKPAVAGAGMLAQSRQDMLIKWKSVRKIKFFPDSHTVMIKGGFTENIALFCTDENYAAVETFIRQKLKGKELLIQTKKRRKDRS